MLDQQKECNKESEVADAVDDECFLTCRCGRVFREPESDQQVRREAHALPANKHHQVVVGEDQHQHEEHEQVQVTEEAVEPVVLPHVADRIDVDEESDTGDDQQHHKR